MKFKVLTIGILLALIPTALETARADYCTLSAVTSNYYKEAYCDMNEWGAFWVNDLNDEIAQVVADQWGFGDAGIVNVILNDIDKTNCELIGAYMLENDLDADDLPPQLNDLCFKRGFEKPQKVLSTQSSADLSIFFQGIQNSYNREKISHTLEEGLEMEFASSERFWDGSLNPIAPLSTDIDLIVDLNLIEVMLFGSRADWQGANDIWQWPKEEDEEGEGGPDGAGGPKEDEEEGEGAEGEEDKPDGVSITGTDPDALTEIMCGPADEDDVDFPSDGGDGTRPVDEDGEGEDGTTGQGEGEMCKDPEAVAFQTPEDDAADSTSAGSQTGNSNNYPYGPNEGCPPGTYPRRDIDITGPPPSDTPTYPQDEQYPGPNVGGTMKQFPPSNRPPCGAGESQVTIDWITGSDSTTCVPTNWCGSFTTLQEKLFGEDCLKDEECSKVALSIEGMFCVEVLKENRPTSPYSSVEGCIDCHIIGIVDTLDKILEKTVTPLQNTTGTFAISSAFKPGFTMNLTVAVKKLVRLAEGYRPSPPEDVDKQLKQSQKDSEVQTMKPQIRSAESVQKQLEDEIDDRRKKVQERLKTYENFRQNTKTLKSQQTTTRIPTLLGQMLDIFDSIQDEYTDMSGSLELNKKEPCQLK